MSTRIILPGGSGFLGRTLARWFAARGADVVTLTRGNAAAGPTRAVPWDAATLGDWAREIDGAAAVINLTGRSVNCRYHARNRRAIMESRTRSTRVLGEAIAACDRPPPVWLNSSTATIYKHTFGRPHGEDGETGATDEARDAFSIEVARAWEAEFDAADTPATRKLVLRTAMVFGAEPGGVYEVLRRLTRFGLGGKMGHGRQYVSWMHADDFCRAIEWLIEKPDAAGVYNLAAPNPITNAEMMRMLRSEFGAHVGLPAVRWMLEIGAFLMRTETELILKSRRVVPTRLLREGFEFRYPVLSSAVAALENAPQSREHGAPPMIEKLLEPLLGHNEWATRVLIDDCRGLSDDQFHRHFEIGPGSLHDTLRHIVGCMARWADRIVDAPLRPSIEERPHTVEELAAALSQADAELRASIEQLVREDRLDEAMEFPAGDGQPPHRFRRGSAVAHVITHGMHHRAQVLNIRRRLGLPSLGMALDNVDWDLAQLGRQ